METWLILFFDYSLITTHRKERELLVGVFLPLCEASAWDSAALSTTQHVKKG